jgi:hypothetical protein
MRDISNSRFCFPARLLNFVCDSTHFGFGPADYKNAKPFVCKPPREGRAETGRSTDTEDDGGACGRHRP